MPTLSPLLTTTPAPVPTYSAEIAETFSWIPVTNTVRPLYAKATYDVNYAAETGQNGASFFNTTTLSAGNWYAIQMIADTTFTGITGNWVGDAVTSGITFKAGTVVYGSFRAIKLATGTAIAYNI